MMVRVADYIASFLYANGIRDIFMLSGGGGIYLDDGIANSNINPVCVCNEATAPMMAEAYARMNGNLGAVIVTTGPGGANAVTGVVEAWVDSAPIIVLSGQVETPYLSRGKLRTYGTQELNIVEIVKSITKYAAIVDDPHMIRYQLEKAVYLARLNRKGPVWLDIPLDVQKAMVSPDSLVGYPFQREPMKAYNVENVYALIEQSERPVFVIGQGIRHSGAIDDFMELIRTVKIPIIVSRLGQDILPHSHPLYCGHAGMKGNKHANAILREADLVVALGSRLSHSFVNNNIHGKLVMVDVDNSEIEKQHVDVPIWADVRDMIQKMLAIGRKVEKPEWIQKCRVLKEENKPVIPDTNPIDLYYLVSVLDRECCEDTVFVSDAGSSYYVTGQVLNFRCNQREITSGAFASMGVALPLAIGASVADKSKSVVAIIGDGSMELNIQELKTLVQIKSNAKIFIVNNGGYASIRTTQDSFGGKHIGSEVGNTMDFGKIAAAFGIPYRKIRDIDELTGCYSILRWVGPVIIEVMCTHNQVIQC